MADNRLYTLADTVRTNVLAHANISNVGLNYSQGLTGSTNTQSTTTQLPFVNVIYGQDETVADFGSMNTSFIDWDVQLFLDLIVDAAVADTAIEETILNLRRDVHEQIMADVTQGLGYVSMSYPIGAGAIEVNAEARRKVASQRTFWGFRLRTSIGNMDS